jgi:hypothetical protein
MSTRNWNEEVMKALEEEERREKSFLTNPRLARKYIERGVAVALAVVLTYCATGMRSIDHHARDVFLAGSIVCSMIAGALISIGVYGLVNQRKTTRHEQPREDDPRAIGW